MWSLIPPIRQHIRAMLSILCLPVLMACSADDPGAMIEPIAPEPLAEADIAEAPSASGRIQSVDADILTAGDIDDNLNFAAFQRYHRRMTNDIGGRSVPFRDVVRIQLLDASGQAAPFARYTIRHVGASEPFHSGRSGVDGRIFLDPSLLNQRRNRVLEIRVFDENSQQTDLRVFRPSNGTLELHVPFQFNAQPAFLDLMFVVDTTGSMSDELAWLTTDLDALVARARAARPGLPIRYGLITYRDQGDAYVTRNFGFTTSMATMQAWLRAQSADGGGDYPEAVDRALNEALAQSWRRGNGKRLLFHIADAPPHRRNRHSYLSAIQTAAQNNVQIFGVAASGADEETEWLMRQASLATGGRYVFLTDDSGIGLPHGEPTVSCYRVTSLTSAIGRILQSEITGQRYEARPNQIIRQVGSYRAGYCLN